MDKEIEQVGSWIQKHAKYLVVVAFIYLMAGTPLGMTLLGIVNPGFPGAMASCYGVNFKDFGTDWQGINTIHAVQNAENSLVTHSTSFLGIMTSSDVVKWGAGCGPASMTILHDRTVTPDPTQEKQLTTEVQTNIPFAPFNYLNSTPLALNGSAWDQGEILQYFNTQPIGVVNSTLADGTIISSVTYNTTSQSLLLIPGNFYLSIYMPSSKSTSGQLSGWQEGTWNQVDLWYVMYWYEWLNACGPKLQEKEVPPNNIPANALNRQDQFNLRGGFPIQGWIQGYQIPYPTPSGVAYDAVSATPASGSSTQNPIAASTMQNIMGQIQLSPSLVGRAVTLYTQPSDHYELPTYTLPGPVDSNVTAQGLMNSPDFQTVLPTQYFKIGVQTLGTTFTGNIGSGFTVYYPCVNYLLRFIFGVYGVHTYLWTVQTALQQGYNATQNYIQPPASWQTRTIVTVNTPGLFTGLLDWWSNPLNALQFYFMIIVIVILIVTVFNPGVWANIFHRRKD